MITPLLEERIEACGGKVRMLLNKGSGWTYTVDGVSAEGNSIEEAVAILQLKLDKTK